MSLTFDYPDFWAFHARMPQSIKAQLEVELIGDGWLFGQSAKEQTKILKDAPQEFVQKIAGQLKPEVQIQYGRNPFLEQWRKSLK